MALRKIQSTVNGVNTSDGAGVRLKRMIGSEDLPMLDPFLMLDVFRSDDAGDYIAGFPEHPHRGFETVTYLVNGSMRHKDNAGHEGVIEPGGVQWMSAGRGILHSEMPEQQEGLLEGFQLWINLPASHKMAPPQYQEFDKRQIPLEQDDARAKVNVIAGTTANGTSGPVSQPLTQPLYLDIELEPGQLFEQSLPPEHNAFAFVFRNGASLVDDDGTEYSLGTDQLAVLSSGDGVKFKGGRNGARLLLIAAQPLGEPVARGGPFVMNTRKEIMQAFADFQAGRF